MAEKYQRCAKKSTKKFELLGRKEVAMRLPLPLVEMWEELQPEVEHLTGLAGLKIIRAVIEDEVTRRVGPRYRPASEEGCLRWGQRSVPRQPMPPKERTPREFTLISSFFFLALLIN